MAGQIIASNLSGNFYKILLNGDRNHIDIDIPQYFVACPIDFIGNCRTISVPLDPVPVEIDNCLRIIMGIPGVCSVSNPFKDKVLVIKNLEKQKNLVVTLGDDTPSTLEYYMSGSSTAIMKIRIRGVLCIDGSAELDIRIMKLKFVKAHNPLSIKLEFYKSKELFSAPPPHFLNMFNQLPEEERECSICKEIIQDGLALTKCYHVFHADCIRRVLSLKCPICQKDL